MSARDLDLDAGAYALGVLTPEDKRALDAERAANPALDRAISQWEARIGGLAATAAPQTPPESLWRKIDAALDALPDPRVKQVRRDDGVWVEILPGVTIKLLSSNAEDGTETFLLKLAPGARVPAHQHPHTEECFVVAGVIEIGAAQFEAGDYVAYPAGVPHTEIQSRAGGTILIRGALA
jgi:quercetin dioxygenase-like cupin family protein